MNYYQTGDILYFKEKKLPESLERVDSGIIIQSPVTGHAHKANGGGLFKTQSNEFWLDVPEFCDLTHEEHKTIRLPEGIYRVQHVKEYDHMLEEARNVVD